MKGEELEHWMYGDPAAVLERKGESCEGCRYLERWNVAGERVWKCDSKAAPALARKAAPERRCDEWRHEKGGGWQ